MPGQMKRLLLSATAVALAFGTAQDVAAQSAVTPMLYVDNSTGDDISVINLAARKVIATVKVGNLPHAICYAADGRRVYTTTELVPTLKVIDSATNTVASTVSLPARPNECAVTEDGRYVIVALRGNNTAAIIDSTTDQIVKSLPIKGAHNCFTPLGGSNDYVYCEEQRGFDIAKIDLKTMSIVDTIKVNGEARPFVVTPDLNTIYVALSDLSGFAVVDVPAAKIAEVVLPPTQEMACTTEPGNTPTHGIALTPDMKKLWITDVAGAGVYSYDLKTKKLSNKVTVGQCPNWIAITSDGKYVAVSNTASDSVSIIDAKSEKVLSEIPVGKGPKRLEFVNVPAMPS
jgi:YVTN family beta-propeller protein